MKNIAHVSYCYRKFVFLNSVFNFFFKDCRKVFQENFKTGILIRHTINNIF